DSTGIPGGGNREGTFASGRASLTWQPTANDFVQVSGFWQGEQLLAQGTREAGGMLNIGYRRKLTEQLSFVFTGRDVLGTFNNDSVFETPAFREEFNQDINLTAFYIGFSWALGNGQRRQPEQFDFSSGPSAG
ncbi:MAG: outer membrane beta-barrel protein, partial [Brevundimonas sp.]|nr:outer membrane beta-barrel protein [Brevundimonas sp.]